MPKNGFGHTQLKCSVRFIITRTCTESNLKNLIPYLDPCHTRPGRPRPTAWHLKSSIDCPPAWLLYRLELPVPLPNEAAGKPRAAFSSPL